MEFREILPGKAQGPGGLGVSWEMSQDRSYRDSMVEKKIFFVHFFLPYGQLGVIKY